MTTRKIVLKKVKVGTPIKTVTAGSFGINNLGGVNTTGRVSGSLLAFNQSSGNFEPVTLTGDSNHFLTFDSSSTPDTLQINFTNDSISGSLIPKLDSAFDLGSSTKKWKDLFLSGSTITLGDLKIQSTGGGIEVKDSDGNTLLQNIKYITVNGDTDILAYDSNTSTFTFNDSDIARTDEIETFHKGVTFADSATFSSNVSVAGNLSITGDLSYDDVSADSAVFSGSVAIGNNLTADSATIPTIATTTINADQQFTDSATITNLANSTLTAKVITNTTLATDSATIGNVAVTTQLTGNQANFDSVASNTLHSTAISSQTLSADSGDIRQLSVDFINADSAFLDSATITNLSTTQITLSQMTLDSATVNNLNVDSSDIRQVSTEFINFDSAFGDSATVTNLATTQLTVANANIDSANITNLSSTNFTMSSGDSATITNIANTQLTGSQATLDSATITKLNVDSSDIDHLSTEAINFDSATGDSATITSIANSTFTGKVITGTNVAFDSATITNVAIATQLTGDQASFDSVATNTLHATNLSVDSGDIRQLSVDFINADSATFDSATIGTLAVGTLNIDAIDIGDSASFTNLAVAQLTGSQATFDSATVTKINVDSADIDHFSTENINFDSATGDSATITNIANSTLTAKVITNTTLVGDSATITNIANDVLTAKAITNTTQVGDSATITNIANSVLTAKAITGTSANIDSATIGNIAITNAVISSGDSATFTNLANTQFTGSQATIDSADIGNLKVTGITNLDSTSATVIDFDNNILDSSPYQEGRVWYDKKFKALAYYSDDSNVIHELGLEEHQKVYNNTGATLLKGKPLYFSGNYVAGDVDVPTVGLADATDENAYNAQGLAAADIPNGAYGYCIIAGQLSGVDTTGLSANTNFFVGLGPGLVQNASPLYPNYPMCLGWVVSSATDGILLVNQQNHSVSSFRVRTSAHVGTNLQVDGDLTVLGSTTSVSSADLTAGTPMFRLNEGNAIGEAGTTFSGTGLDDAFYSGFFKGTANQTYYVRIDGVGTGPGGVDTFEVALGNDSTFTSPTETKTAITGNDQLIHSTDNISIKFSATTGHDSSDRWSGTAGPINVDTGFFSNRNTGGSGVGFTYVGIYYDVSDNKWKLIDEYDSNPTGAINEGDASYSKGTLVLDTVEGNVTGNLTGTIQTGNQPNITAVGTLTSLAVANGFSADSGDIRQLSTDFINTDSAFMDSATITNLANDVLTAKAITNTSQVGDSATITNIASNSINTNSLIVDDFTVDGSTITNASSNDVLIDANAGIILDADDNGTISFRDGGTRYGVVEKSSNDFHIQSMINDGDFKILGKDGSSTITALTLDMSEAGDATFNRNVKLVDDGQIVFGTGSDANIKHDGNNTKFTHTGTGGLYIGADTFALQNGTHDENFIVMSDNSSVELYENNVKRLETSIYGVTVTGTVNADSSTLTNLTVDSADIRQLSVDFINADSAFLDSATITTLAVGTLNIDNINIGDSATFTNIAVSTALNTNQLIVDDITIDGSSIADAGDFSLDIEGDITFDANGGNVKLSDDGLLFTTISRDAANTVIKVNQSDGDLVLKGNDGGSEITALTLDMSEAGEATFNSHINLPDNARIKVGAGDDLQIYHDGSNSIISDEGTGGLFLRGTNTVDIQSALGHNYIKSTISAGTKIYFDNAEKFETTSYGANITGTLTVGNLNVDSADIIKIARDNISGRNGLAYNSSTGVFDLDSANTITSVKNALSTGSPDALTYDSAAGQFALNANHVMALIQTIDSNGSGLNADTLDGQSGSHYRINVYNASGTLLN